MHNACATISLLNIVNNVPEHHLGEELRSFKHFTKDFTPALRGDAVGNFEFVKHIHNSFARCVAFDCGQFELGGMLFLTLIGQKNGRVQL